MKKGVVKELSNPKNLAPQDVLQAIDRLSVQVQECFQMLGKCLADVEKQVQSVETRLTLFRLHVDERFDYLEERSTLLETRVDVLAMNTDGLAHSLQTLSEEQHALVSLYKKHDGHLPQGREKSLKPRYT